MVRGLGKVFGSALSAVQESLTNPAMADGARERAAHVREEFKEEADRFEPAMQQVGEKLKEALRSPEVTRAIDDIGHGLQDLAAALKGERPSKTGDEAGDGGAGPLHPKEDQGDDQQGQNGGAEHPADDGDGHGGAKL